MAAEFSFTVFIISLETEAFSRALPNDSNLEQSALLGSVCCLKENLLHCHASTEMKSTANDIMESRNISYVSSKV
jgi:hypothetical protein